MTLDLISHMTSHAVFDPSVPGYHPSPATYPFLAPSGSPAAAYSPSYASFVPELNQPPTSGFYRHRSSSMISLSIAPPAMTSIFPRFTHIDVGFFHTETPIVDAPGCPYFEA
jgi:hypothetical protein